MQPRMFTSIKSPNPGLSVEGCSITEISRILAMRSSVQGGLLVVTLVSGAARGKDTNWQARVAVVAAPV